MNKILILILGFVLGFFSYSNGQNFLSTNGGAIVNESGDTIILRGMGLGGWMVQEGYMLQTSAFAGPQWEIKEKIEELIGPADTQLFYDAWLANHVRKIDIDSLKAWGFNSVRLPMHYNLYTLPIQDEPVAGENTWLTKGFELTDSLISWCAQNEMYVVLDLHAAPGGQGYAQEISDYNPSLPSLWESAENRSKTVELWRQLAQRYNGNQWVAGYDILNEPNWDLPGGTALRNLYNNIIDAIRSEDPDHIVFIEGNWFANDFTGLTPPWVDNFVYAPHKYWSYNGPGELDWALTLREQYNVPIYIGESGENSNVWFKDAIRLMEDEGVGFAWWPLKKVESVSCPLSVTKSDSYQVLLDYWENGGTQPSATFAKNALMELAENLKLENCFHQKDVPDAIIRQVQTDVTIPYSEHNIPGVIYATDYDLGRSGEAYFDTQDANYHLSTGNYTAWNNGWIYRNDGVDIERSNDAVNSNGFNVGWIDAGEWMQYEVNVMTEGVYDVNVRIANGAYEGVFYLSADGGQLSGPRYVPHTQDYQNWQTMTIPNVVITSDLDKIRFNAIGGSFNLGSFEFIQVGDISDIDTEFLSAYTLSSNEIQLNLNKPLNALSASSENDFEIFSNGASIPILNVEQDPDNTRIIYFTVDDDIVHDDVLKINYTGNQITATDASSLETFILEDVENREPIIHPVPGKVEAEEFFNQNGIAIENTTDVGGGKNIAHLDNGDYIDYYIDVAVTGTYSVDYRTSSESEDGSIQLQLIDENEASSVLHNMSFASTGSWQTWETTSSLNLFLYQGRHHIRLRITDPGFNLNWFEFNLLSSSEDLANNFESLNVFPNPTSDLFTVEGILTEVQDIEIEILNLLGQRMKYEQLNNVKDFKKSIDVGLIPNGHYLIRIITENGEQKTMKLLKG